MMSRNKKLHLPFWLVILATLTDTSTVPQLSRICRKIDLTYSQGCIISQMLEKQGYITRVNKDKKVRHLVLTSKGRLVGDTIAKVIEWQHIFKVKNELR